MSLLQMQPDVVDEAGRRLRASGDQLQTSWRNARSAIATYEGGIRSGRLADAFLRTYRPASQQAMTNADPFPGRITDLGTATSLASYLYVTVDNQVAERFRQLRDGG